MNNVLTMVCLFMLLIILALPLGLIASQWFASAALQRQRTKEEMCD